MTPDKTPSDTNLQERCAEIVEWQRTGVLPGNALRNYAAKHWAGHTDALQMAERDTSALAMEQIAKWGSPVVAGEPVAWRLRDEEASSTYRKDVYVYYDRADFKENINPIEICDGLECLYSPSQITQTCVIEAAVRKQDDALIRQLVEALDECKDSTQERIDTLTESGIDKHKPRYFRSYVQDLQRATDAISAARARLEGKPCA